MKIELTERGRHRANIPGHSSIAGAILDRLAEIQAPMDTRDLAIDLQASEGTILSASQVLGKHNYITKVAE